MSIFGWLKNGGVSSPPPDKTTVWLSAQIREAAESDVLALAQACAALTHAGSMAFGMILSPQLASRGALAKEALAALRKAIANLPDDRCDAVFSVIEGARLDVDIRARRKALEASRKAGLERSAAWLRDQIAERAGGDITELVTACVALAGRGGMAFGMSVPAGLDREPLLAAALAAVRARIPTLDAQQARYVKQTVVRAALSVDLDGRLDERLAELAATQAEDRERARAEAATSEPSNPALEREIEANPDSDDALAVFADWLQAEGHPRGELIALQLRGADAANYLETHAKTLLGPLYEHRLLHDGSERPAFTWKRGFIHRAHLSINDYASQATVGLVDILELLLVHPSGRLLQELAIGINGEDREAPLDAVIALLAREAPPSLRTLHLGAFEYHEETEMSWYEIGTCAPLWPRLRGLRTLIVQGGSFTLGAIDLPALEHAEFRTGGLSTDSAAAIAKAHWPRLRRLDVWCGDPNYGCEVTLSDLRAIWERKDLPELRHLGLMNSELADDICEALPGVPLIAQLETLDLSMGTLSDDGARALVAAAPKWPGLQRLDVSNSFLSDEVVAELRSAFPTVIADEQRDDDPEDRYVAVGE
jgi:uncharacterized protein (TIGR02996 family)